MDPYLEDPAHWRGVHAALIVGCYESLNATLPEGFIARIEERLYLTIPGERYYPDVSVETVGSRPSGGVATRAPSTAVIDAPIQVAASVQEIRQRFVEVIALDGPERVVTAIEILSPTNKTPGDGREEYLRKQTRYLQSDTHLLEIDLLRAGRHTVAASESELKALRPAWSYIVSLHRAGSGLRCDAWTRTVREPLPTVPVPLTPEYPDATLPLQKIFDRLWEVGPFRRSLDYAAEPNPPLSEDDALWINDLLHQKGQANAS